MGVTSENVAAKFNVSRRTQDEFAARSHNKAAAAQAAGKFKASTLPIVTLHFSAHSYSLHTPQRHCSST